ncbi:hypothetical protein BKA61DRAFT_687369 [Leptodontidium sp. MPI-SDFR-AT-0119]|nr:hypothetical protein BKA61DRAFT_687369 [Leptodontidium sp. MPI-SDFR-AT-0119]
MATVTDQAPPSPRRSTISALPAPATRTRKNGGNGQCTHLTTTRLYTEDFRCALCLRVGSFGWLYRCTQDRELLLDEDMENGFEEKLDKFCDILPESISPRKRSAAARADKLSFLTEISDEAMKSYTPEQLKIVLAQRAHVLDQLSQPDSPDSPDFPEAFYENRPLPTPTRTPHPNPPPGLPIPPVSPSNNDGLKPWFPLQGGECQFKCCHFCRPSLKERSFLSLNGIADGDIPATSITGFGFHLQKQRPVALVKHVQNLGLRPNPSPRPPPHQDPNQTQHHSNPSSPTLPPKKRVKRRPTSLGLGLGIFASEAVHPSASPTYTAPPSPRPPLTPTFSTRPSTLTSSGLSITIPRPTTPILNSFEHQALSSRPDLGIAVNRRHSYSPSPSLSSSISESSQRMQTPATATALPPPTPNEQSLNMLQMHSPVAAQHIQTEQSALPVPPTCTSMSTSMSISTAMETDELIQGEFSSAPLEVKDGIAVTEESVELHVADVTTQF